MLNELKALMLLEKCRGDEIWSVEFCQQQGVPQDWIDELNDCFESGFASDHQTIYVGSRLVNQYHGVRDRDLAFRLGELLGVDTNSMTAMATSKSAEVRLIKEAVDEG